MSQDSWSDEGVGCLALIAFLAGCFFTNWMLS